MACIAIIDGIVDAECNALSGVAVSVERAMIPDGFDKPDSHATEIASLIFGNGANGSPEHNPLTCLSLPIFFHSGTGSTAAMASQMDLARALTIAAERDAAIVNISAGQKAASSEAGRHLQDAVNLCLSKRILIIAAAGNDGCACLHVPAAINGVLAVGAMDLDGRPFEKSNFGAAYKANGILAPGVELQVTGTGNEALTRSGTSYATAVVTQVAGQLLAQAQRTGVAMDPIDIMSVILDSADACVPEQDEDCSRILAGRLNIAAAFQLFEERAFARTPPLPVQPSHLTQPKPLEGIHMSDVHPTAQASPIAAQPAPAPQPAPVMPQAAASATDMMQPAADIGQSACSCQDKKEEVTASTSVSATVPPAASPALPVAQSASNPHSPTLSQLSCGCGGESAPAIAYALGALWFDYGTEARYDAIVQQMGSAVAANTPAQLLDFLSDNPEFAGGVTFVLMQDQIPIYAIQPAGPFAVEIYQALIDSIKGALDDDSGMHRVGIPGLIKGTTRLMNGMILPMLYPDKRGMAEWKTQELVAQVREFAENSAGDAPADDKIFNFLVRVYDELRNLGAAPQERAINFAATNAFQAARAFSQAAQKELELYTIKVNKSPICRPDSDCWDVQLQMFDPENERRAGRIYRFTVDVSETLPVTIGPMRQWSAPLTQM
ncbi:cyanobactin maturation protease, PatA/PatG family [Hoeflea phototrophica DFL-43]|uniref:Cyanobactin maturation protease, PatA/PatG family n=1 Tax=Hoeflea phototrophica (strain DSM 17068 / NCIMB 14078 / DFL-43) TaxID=411684 RepID=A9D255_HOEPD|nr:PatA/PatG family cyanobactin maturation protease [Hoeflea phototrophica]EDQ34136.1 cyanobactin maturation protease, PatA/PatG family [Hoeflea phototrophica DFL-43]